MELRILASSFGMYRFRDTDPDSEVFPEYTSYLTEKRGS